MVIVTGSIAYDYIMDFPGVFSDHILPEKIHAINLSFIVNKFARRRGGTAGNVSYTLGLLKTPHTLFSYAGKDFEEYKKEFEKFGIDTSDIKIDKKTYTATGFAMADKNNNQIWGYFYGAAENNAKLQLKTKTKQDDLVLIGPAGKEGPSSFIKQCIEGNFQYMFDPGFSLTYMSNNDLAMGITHATYLIGNDYEMELIKERVRNWREIFSSKIIITTLGEKGALIQTSNKMYTIKNAKAKRVVDPSGAGDAWRGGFLAGLEQGFDLQTCGEMGSIASVYAVEHYGTQEHTYSQKEFETRYRQNFGNLLHLLK